MGTRSNHREKADHNQAFLESIADRKTYCDWIVTVAFYKALHLVEMVFADAGKHSDNLGIGTTRSSASTLKFGVNIGLCTSYPGEPDTR
jgi:hypothetical protein